MERDDGSIGIGAMIVFIALILVAAVASTIIIKTAEELQQNAENTSSDTRQQISGKVQISDVFVKSTANPMNYDHTGGGGVNPLPSGSTDPCGPGTRDCLTDVATFEVIARIGSGSLNVQQGDIMYYVTCGVTYSQLTPDTAPWASPTETLGKTVAAVDSGIVQAQHLDGTAYSDGEEITAGTTFRWELDLSPTNVDIENTNGVNQDIEDADFATSTPVGCDAEAGVDQRLNMRIVVDGGGETLVDLKIPSLSLGTSVM